MVNVSSVLESINIVCNDKPSFYVHEKEDNKFNTVGVAWLRKTKFSYPFIDIRINAQHYYILPNYNCNKSELIQFYNTTRGEYHGRIKL